MPLIGGSKIEIIWQRLSIIGLGLIGGSIGLALTHCRQVKEVVGVDIKEEILKTALETGAVTEATADLKEGVNGAELVILAVPVGQIIPVAQQIKPYLLPQTVITDVGSVKKKIVEELEKLLGRNYIGGHPLAGSQEEGIKAADRYLLQNALYLLTPTSYTSPLALTALSKLIKAVGARPVQMEPEEHDRIVALISHLPHLTAATLVETVAEVPAALPFASGGFRDTTRVASGSEKVWSDIFLYNRQMVLEALELFQKKLEDFRLLLLKGDKESLSQKLLEIRKTRQSIPERRKGLLPPVYEVIVTVADRPGIIAELAGILGKEGINIIDLEILSVREGEGGSIRFGFQSSDAQRKAFELFKARGITTRIRN